MLAVNDFGVQAASFTHGRGTFWGVQYHPEYDYLDIAAAAERYGETLVSEGMFRDERRARRFRRRLRALQANPPTRRCSGSTDSGPPCEPRRCACSKSATGWRLRCGRGGRHV